MKHPVENSETLAQSEIVREFETGKAAVTAIWVVAAAWRAALAMVIEAVRSILVDTDHLIEGDTVVSMVSEICAGGTFGSEYMGSLVIQEATALLSESARYVQVMPSSHNDDGWEHPLYEG